MIKNSSLLEKGYVLADFPLESVVYDYLRARNWRELDQYFLGISKKPGQLREFLADYLDFESLEHIIAIRSAPEDEDGIWHDDGSRFCGFSLALNLDPQKIEGGNLYFKRKEATQAANFAPQPIGKIIIFLSGLYGYEHMVSAVTGGERIVIAGWCS